MNPTKCEVCEGPSEYTCGYDDQPMLHFCSEDFVDHLERAHNHNGAAIAEAARIRAKMKTSEAGLRALLK